MSKEIPDISMCLNQECEKKESCYRFTATPKGERQSYADFKPDEDGNCDYYWNREPIAVEILNGSDIDVVTKGESDD